MGSKEEDDKARAREEYESGMANLNGPAALFNPAAGIPRYFKAVADGKMYQESGDGSYVPAEPGLAFHELPDGSYVAVRDMAEAESARKSNSHQRFFNGLPDDPKAAKRQIKKVEALQKQFEQLAIDRVLPPTGGPKVEFIKDEKYLDLQQQYARAQMSGQGRQCEFQPVASYQHKLITKSGKVLRPLFQGEVGMMGETVICLEAGYGTGVLISVPGQVRGE